MAPPGTLRRMRLLFALSFAASLLQALTIPTLALYAYSLSFSEAEIGAITGASSLVYVAATLFAAPLVRKLSTRGVVAAALLSLSAGYLLHPVSRSSPALLAATSLVFAGFGLLWPSVEVAVAASGGNASRFSFSWSSGSLVGTALVSPFAGLGAPRLYAIYAALSSSLLLGVARLPLEGGRRGRSTSKRVSELSGAWLLCVSYASSSAGFLTFYPVLVERSGLPRGSISLVLFSMIAARTAVFYLYERLPSVVKSAYASMPLLLTPLAVPLSTDPLLHVVAAVFAGVGQSLVYSSALTAIFRAGGVASHTAAFEASIGLGYVAGPIAGSVSGTAGLEPIPATALLASALVVAAGLGERAVE